MIASGGVYRIGVLRWLERPHFELTEAIVAAPSSSPQVRAALAADCIRGLVGWARFPFVEVEEDGGGWTVHVLDARYTRRRTRGFGGDEVRVDRRLSATCAR